MTPKVLNWQLQTLPKPLPLVYADKTCIVVVKKKLNSFTEQYAKAFAYLTDCPEAKSNQNSENKIQALIVDRRTVQILIQLVITYQIKKLPKNITLQYSLHSTVLGKSIYKTIL